MRDDVNFPPLPEGYRWSIQKFHMFYIQDNPPGDYLAVAIEQLQVEYLGRFTKLFRTPRKSWAVLELECVYPNPPTPKLIEEAAERLLARRSSATKKMAKRQRLTEEKEKLREEHSKMLDEFVGVYSVDN